MKPHARRRLWERHGIEITEGEIRQLGQRLAVAEYRENAKLFKWLCDSRHDTSIWQANLEPYLGREYWVTVVWAGKPKPRLKTVLPVPANLTAEQARQYLDKTNDKASQNHGKRGPNQLPRDRRDRKRA